MLTRLRRRAWRHKKRIWQTLATLLTLIIIDRFVAPRHVPWRSLDVDAPIGLATGTKLTLISLAPSRVCLDKLASAQYLSYVQAAPKDDGKCGWNRAATMREASKVKFRPSTVTAQCPLMLASYIWLGAVDKAAQARFGSRLKIVHHAGTYSCRRQRGNSSGEWSEHAFANAWDITGFELNDGRVISVLKHWDKGSTKESKARAKFLRDARRSACQLFRVVLTPDFNTAHNDHFHLEQGPSSSCR